MALQKLDKKGHEIKELDYNVSAREFPKAPEAPKKEQFTQAKEYEQAVQTFERRNEEYARKVEELDRMKEEGRIKTYVKVGQTEPELCYVEINRKETAPVTIEILQERDKRFKQLSTEKIVADTKKIVRENDYPESPFTQYEDGMLYFIMLTKLQRKHYPLCGIKDQPMPLDEKQRMKIVAKLTDAQRTVIKRDFIIHSLCEGGYGDNSASKLLRDFANMHFPDQYGLVKATHEEEYQKRHERLEERIKEMKKAEKKAAKKAVKESQKEFTKRLASYADCYVNDAFGTAHRAHASTALIADYFDTDNKMFGYLMEKEVKAVDKVMNDIQRPFTAIMGGSKVSSKIEIIENLLNKVDNLIIAGGMTYTFTKAMGGKIGISICEDDKLDLALDLMKKAKEKGVNLVLAVDAKIADDFSNDAKTAYANVNEIPDGWEGLDIGPKTIALYAEVIKNSKTILWNGPTGVFEFENFTDGSRAVGEAIVEATKNGAFSLVGGGDSVACVNKFGLANGVSYVSTGGGALLEAIEGKVLPGIAAVKGEAYK